METYYSTPDPSLLLSADGILVARMPGVDVRVPTREEVSDALAVAAGRVMDQFDRAALAYMPVPLLRSEHDLYEKTRNVWEKIPEFGDFYEFAFAIGDLVGWTQSQDPLLEQVRAMDQLLHGYFKLVDQQIFASWSATRLAMLADVQALASSARDTIASIVLNNEDLDAPLTINQLALADRDSKIAVNTFDGVDSGYWRRPYSGSAIGLETWGTKLDDRAPLYDDGTVWDPRIAMPTLLYALVVRTIVLKGLYSSRQKYCREIKRRVAFLLDVQSKWQTGIRRKLHLSAHEMGFGAGFSVRPFAAGAVDVFTGAHDLIDVDWGALNLYFARGFWGGPLPPSVTPIPPELVAPNITRDDIDMRFENEYRPILEKQSAVALTRLRWSTGLHAFSDTIKSLGQICAEDPTDQLVTVYRDSLQLVREAGGGIKPTGAADCASERVELARALARAVHPGARRTEPRAMADRYALYCALREDDGALISELRELVTRYMQRERPWRVRRYGERRRGKSTIKRSPKRISPPA